MSRGAVVLCSLSGIALVWGGLRLRERQSVRTLTARLQLPYGEHDHPISILPVRRLTEITAALAPNHHRTGKVNRTQQLAASAQIGGVGVVVGLVMWTATHRLILGVFAAIAVPLSAAWVVRNRQRREHERIRRQLPHTLMVLASSLEAGATVERSLVMLASRSEDPLGGELTRLNSEVDLGADLVEAVERMIDRTGVEDLRWWVYALSLQRKVGGPLAPITRTLAEIMNERAELQQQVRVLTAEGRASAFVLGALPVVIMAAVQTTNPDYLAPFYSGWGLVALGALALSIMVGVAAVLRMVKGPNLP